MALGTADKVYTRKLKKIGISISDKDLNLLHIFQQRNHFMDVYLVKKDINIENIIFDKHETVDVKWISKDELNTLIKSQKVVRSVAQRYELLMSKL